MFPFMRSKIVPILRLDLEDFLGVNKRNEMEAICSAPALRYARIFAR